MLRCIKPRARPHSPAPVEESPRLCRLFFLSQFRQRFSPGFGERTFRVDKDGENSGKRPLFWLESRPLLLASKSEGRRLALSQAAIPFEVSPAEIDERAIEAQVIRGHGEADAVVLALSRAKALKISQAQPGRLVV